ncbi:hypothetical protein P8610_13350 [Fictibacillus sp. UD]
MVVVEGGRLLRDRRAGETLKSETLRMWLTACPAESEHLERKATPPNSNKVCENSFSYITKQFNLLIHWSV